MQFFMPHSVVCRTALSFTDELFFLFYYQYTALSSRTLIAIKYIPEIRS